MQYYKVKNWEHFQHYKDRNPPWIKLHRALLDDYEFSSLPDQSKAHLLLIWVLASQMDGRVPADGRYLASKIGARTSPDLKLLAAAGWLVPEPTEPAEATTLGVEQHASKRRRSPGHSASNTLAPCKHDASKVLDLARSRETETETEAEERQSARATLDGPNEQHLALAQQMGLDCRLEWAQFEDRIQAKGKWFKDKSAAFRMWLRQERKFADRDGRGRLAANGGSLDVGEVV